MGSKLTLLVAFFLLVLSLQALQYLRRLCSHPLLVLNLKSQESSIAPIQSDGASSAAGGKDGKAGLHDLHNAPKLLALKEILEECGIGVQGAGGEEAPEGGQHRVLIFAQLKVSYVTVSKTVL